MKIENTSMSSITQMETLQKKATPHETTPPAKSAGEAFSVELSSTTEQRPAAQSPDEISRERVAAIRDQLASGTYNISGKDVANKILGVLKK